jgi:hypothetical protein
MTGRFTFIISPLANVAHLFRNWLNGIDKQTKVRILIGVCGLLILAIWNCRNNIIFNKVEGVLVFAIHNATYCIKMWSYLLPEHQKEPMKSGWTRLMTVVWTIFSWVARSMLIG